MIRESYTPFWWENLKERDHLEDSSIDGRIILIWIYRKLDGGMAQYRDRWWGLVNAAMNLRAS